MNNLAYSTQNPEEVANHIEELIRKELNETNPLSFKTETENSEKSGLGTVLKDSFTHIFGGKESLLFSVVFDIQQPRPVKIIVHVNRQGIGCHAGTIVFTTNLKKTVKSEVALEEPKFFGTSKFTGDVEAIEKLNSNKDLLKKADKFANTKSNIGGNELEIARFLKISPSESGSVLVVNTLAKSTSMGFSASIEAKMFFELVNLIESVL
jgi:hypothetical protein